MHASIRNFTYMHVCANNVADVNLQALNYSEEMLSQREVVTVDIATEQSSSGEYKPEQVRGTKCVLS